MSFFALYDGSRVPRPEAHILSKKLLFDPKRYFFPGGRAKECCVSPEVVMPISLPLPLPLGVRCPPRPGLAAPPLAVVTYESTREPKEASTKGIISINVRAGRRAGG